MRHFGHRLAILLTATFLGGVAHAQAPAKRVAPKAVPKAAPQAQANKAPEKEAVLDFEAELIEGERKRPDLFLQIGTQKQTMEAIIYGRKNFNDFHRIDSRKRPTYFEPKEPAK